MKQEDKNNKCPFCGAQKVDREMFFQKTGLIFEETIKWNGELKMIIQLGKIVLEGQKSSGSNTIQFEKFKEQIKEEFIRIELARRELDKKSEQLRLEQEKLLKLKEDSFASKTAQIPNEIMKKLEEQNNLTKEQISNITDLLNNVIHSNKTSGTLLETQMMIKLKNLNTGDDITHLGGPDQEDILSTVKDNGKILGKIKIDSKNVDKWDNKFIDKMNRYLKDNQVDFGIIATTTMPKDAAPSDFYLAENNILVVNIKTIEAVYLVCRYLLIKNDIYLTEFNNKTSLLRESENKMKAIVKFLETSSFKRFFEKINEEIKAENDDLDKLENYIKGKIKTFKDTNNKILVITQEALGNEKSLQDALQEKNENVEDITS
jgi:hypothetical protein